MKQALILALLLSFPASARAKGVPKDVSSYLARLTRCHRLGSQEPVTPARAKTIEREIEKLGCLKLDDKERDLREQYKEKPEILKKIDDAKAEAI